jgi:hypothetical protein
MNWLWPSFCLCFGVAGFIVIRRIEQRALLRAMQKEER